jgi:hypothetical protein
VTEIDDIADILRGTIVLFVLHVGVPLAFPWLVAALPLPQQGIGVRSV